ncbi:bifunctional 2-polyprenyl-6-hydroxyphenol methylase/3-demethylubiquinol 3-O-methyltransferase UbiG [Streptomyces huiliensis]|uniref:bifunctional 2-polyprenyl-6-hydroxyphenol methylase/3-demethylubiquinol 3-O-methyltransferase UbiG n=1 Tax=Streptomyces huiliensis TaxID=2876027 RepID=UPI001CBE03C4|nr:bifunctional 2-polyprenyl-6-hydroxyphenol methylase/3-demethylubiquinol 3-O-methyltransferase UbiG [Streptomyces huiliensis]MBZ4322083.1 bifunctional 2-polyprenyl-6-hydroxyphenol methylase/3-demethylubiquinol 3-O-methyltransferase UbiG [Streptomyces huiliensis]
MKDAPVKVNNAVYDQPDSWWRDDRPFATLQEFTPARFAYFHDVLTRRLRMDLDGLNVLDIGCGGGLLAEEFTRAGCRVTGIDPSQPSLDAAAEHAKEQGLDITYRQGTAEELPFAEGEFDLVYCCDTLEHVTDVDRAVAEASRVLRPGGHYLYDTINRTFASWLVMVKMAQDWPSVSWAEKDLHVWRQFIKPDELYRVFGRHGLRNKGQVGFSSSRGRLEVLRLLRRRARGHISYGELGREFRLGTSTDISVIYAGYARKDGGNVHAGR